MTNSERRVRCPVCADEFVWPDDPLVWVLDEDHGRYMQIDTSSMPPAKRADLMKFGYRLCPNPQRDEREHYLPATYADYDDPLVIALVGGSDSGKTHLLTAMIRQAHLGGLAAYGLSVRPMDFRRHQWFRRQYIEPFEAGKGLPGSSVGLIEAADILLIEGPAGKRPLVFFDIAGEDQKHPRPLTNRFLMAASGVIFVHSADDPLHTGRVHAESENPSFDLASTRLAEHRVPAVIAVSKSDRLRYTPPADRWLFRGDEKRLDARRIKQESRDAYAYLHQVGAGASLRPFESFSRCALHFVSASGGDPLRVKPGSLEEYFPRGFRPRRVLEPLVSLLAMTGMITGGEAGKVGLP